MIGLAIGGTWLLKHESMWFPWLVAYAIPVLSLAFVAWAVVSRRLSNRVRWARLRGPARILEDGGEARLALGRAAEAASSAEGSTLPMRASRWILSMRAGCEGKRVWSNDGSFWTGSTKYK